VFVRVVFFCTIISHCLAWYHNRFTLLDLFVQFILTCAEHLPHKIPLYGTLVEISFLSWTGMTSVILFSCMLQYLIVDVYAWISRIYGVFLFSLELLVSIVTFGSVYTCSILRGNFIWWTCINTGNLVDLIYYCCGYDTWSSTEYYGLFT